jgi:predicted nucleotidyltransferase component of viral defense system
MNTSPASIHRRLLNLSRQTGQDFNRLLTLYAHERLLARLSASAFQKHYILKGGLYLYSQYGNIARPTRDLDLLAQQVANDQQIIVKQFQTLMIQNLEDGMRYDPDSLTAHVIKEDADYEGLRLSMTGYLGNARIILQIDLGFGDVLSVPQHIDYPCLLPELNSPKVLAYNAETVIAEKFQAMTILGTSNSRSKDFYDIFLLAKRQIFHSDSMLHALESTFKRRETRLEDSHYLFDPEFSQDKDMQLRWQQFKTRHTSLELPETFVEVMQTLGEFLKPLIVEKINASWNPQIQTWRQP